MQTTQSSGPLAGTIILDLTTMLSGPMATMLLADQGASVIKVERPGEGDYTRLIGRRNQIMSAMFLNNNRNKQSIAVDLKSEAGIDVVKTLARKADVLVENFRPGVMARLGLSYEEMRTINSKLIFTSITGFGNTGPWMNKPTYDPLVQAASGLATIQAGSDAARPKLVRTILADKVTALTASQAIVAALYARKNSMTGQHVHISMSDAVRQFLWASDMNDHTFVQDDDAQPPTETKASFVDLIYEVKDGYLTISVMTDAQWSALCRVLDRSDLQDDPRFSTAALRELNVDTRLQMTQEAIIDWPRDRLLNKLEAAHVPCAPVLTRTESYAHPQAIATDATYELDEPNIGRIRQARHAAAFEKTPADQRRSAPYLGADSVSVLSAIGYSQQEISTLLSQGVVTAQVSGADQ
ncbi:CaiB/BaiF CoA transferase family protein [Cognatishimia activa]|uniref:Formyl-coenzyme A transferase n=1 Tax=Cognatishimia activa TaxID=1715691 RepID=A0A0P1IPQ1_9RHOB|nr:CoA transferase [Cognatishimia activa]CUI85043.1 Formyl-coenzyme A transferase [Cognatishimia activa]CUK25540.1 Formyl-coenzyme A transferase [Cognatishimia activa]